MCISQCAASTGLQDCLIWIISMKWTQHCMDQAPLNAQQKGRRSISVIIIIIIILGIVHSGGYIRSHPASGGNEGQQGDSSRQQGSRSPNLPSCRLWHCSRSLQGKMSGSHWAKHAVDKQWYKGTTWGRTWLLAKYDFAVYRKGFFVWCLVDYLLAPTLPVSSA